MSQSQSLDTDPTMTSAAAADLVTTVTFEEENDGAVTATAAGAGAGAALAANHPKNPNLGSKNSNKQGGGQRKNKEASVSGVDATPVVVPIEELFDLTKPIPKVDRPDKVAHEATLQEMTAALDAIKAQQLQIQAEIDAAMKEDDDPATTTDPHEQDEAAAANEPNDSANHKNKSSKTKRTSTTTSSSSNMIKMQARNQLNALKQLKQGLVVEKKSLRNQLDALKTQNDKLVTDRKHVRAQVKFASVDEIDTEIKKLQRQQETTTMSLAQEKKLLKEIDTLQQSKKCVADLKNKDVAMDSVKDQKKIIAQQIAVKDKEMDDLAKQMDAVMAILKAQADKEAKKRESLTELFKKRDDLKQTFIEALKEKNALWDAFRVQNTAYYNAQRAIRAQKQLAYEEEKAKREEEKAAYLAMLEAEEAKKIPYEEEQALCDYLADYLERTYLSSTNGSNNANGTANNNKTSTSNSSSSSSSSHENAVAVVENPFAGYTPANKKSANNEYYYLGGGAAKNDSSNPTGGGAMKKKRVRAGKKKQDDIASGPLTLSMDLFEQFGLINMNPPTSVAQVEGSVEALRAKKEWYKHQPRGSVPTAKDIRKANATSTTTTTTTGNNNEKASTSSTILSNTDGRTTSTKTTSKKTPSGSGFSLSSHDDFAPLGNSNAAQVQHNAAAIALWGQKVVVAETTTTTATTEEPLHAVHSVQSQPEETM